LILAEPFPADEAITTRLRDGLSWLTFESSIIVAGGTTTSFAERGLL
jgi:DNA repair protein RadC